MGGDLEDTSGGSGLDPRNPTVARCVLGAEAEFQGRLEAARAHFEAAWAGAVGDMERAIAAHYMAHSAPDEAAAHPYNLRALAHAQAAPPAAVAELLPSLHVNIGRSFEALGDLENAQEHYAAATRLGLTHTVAPPSRFRAPRPHDKSL